MKVLVAFERDPDGGYAAHVLGMPGCVSQGDTLDEARQNIREALKLYLEEASDEVKDLAGLLVIEQLTI